MKSLRNLPFHTRRDAWVEIDLSAIEHNILEIKSTAGEDVEIMAVIKADAYGHGALMVEPALEASGVSMLGVAAMDEALQIRNAGLNIPVLVLGVTPDWAMHYAIENDIQVTIFSQLHLDSLKRLYNETGQPAEAQIKVDTGMHRIGLAWEEAARFIEHCQSLSYIKLKGIFSHLAYTENREFTELQISRWNKVLDSLSDLPPLRHLANSSALWHYQDLHIPSPHPYGSDSPRLRLLLSPSGGEEALLAKRSEAELSVTAPVRGSKNNMIRAGISIFGYPGDSLPLPVELKPAMGLKARIVHIHELPDGEGISYNQTWRNESGQPVKIATLPLGYADGIPRALSNKMEGIYQGKMIRQVGTISMDQLMMNVTDIPDAAVGDVITLLGSSNGKAITLTDWAKVLNTIEYELMCSIRVRLPKTCVR